MRYYELLERLTELMTALDEEFDIPEIFATLAEMCKLLNVSKGVTTFYATQEDEKRGTGEEFVCYDSGEEHVLISSIRTLTPANVVIKCEVFQARGAEPLNDEDRRKVEIVQRMMVTYMNKTRQEDIIRRLMYVGDDGFYNLRYFYGKIAEFKQKGELVGKTTIRINLRHFSLINNQFGMAAGDAALHGYCRKLTKAINGSGNICRLGGDNFVAYFDTKCLPDVVEVLNGVPVTYDEENNQKVIVSACAGVYSIKDDSDIIQAGDVMGRTVDAYLIAKRQPSQSIIYYTDELQSNKERDIKTQHNFDTALREEEFLVYYQPKVDIQTLEIVGAEALCRWRHDGAIIPPLDFIPVLENGNDICRLDFYMLEHVCRDIRRWLDSGLLAVRVSVNFSRRHMMNPELSDQVVAVLDKYQVPHELIEIELTETTTDVELSYLKRVVNEFQKEGIFVSVDDFGVGYSSLNLIKQIPWNVLKLDKSIIPADGEDRERGSRMFAHIIAMAHEIGMKCVAEGVETEDQLELMKRYGCHIAQGFFFDRPMPVEEFEKRLANKKYTISA